MWLGEGPLSSSRHHFFREGRSFRGESASGMCLSPAQRGFPQHGPRFGISFLPVSHIQILSCTDYFSWSPDLGPLAPMESFASFLTWRGHLEQQQALVGWRYLEESPAVPGNTLGFLNSHSQAVFHTQKCLENTF